MHRLCMTTVVALRDEYPDDPGYQFDWAACLVLGVGIALAKDEPGVAIEYQQHLSTVELHADAIAGRFRLRMLPFVLDHLELVTRYASPARRTRVCRTVLELEPLAPQVDFGAWRSMMPSDA